MKGRFESPILDNPALVEKTEMDLLFLEQIKATIKELDINAEVEINPGTSSTPGRHLRIVSPNSLKLEALYQTLQTLGIQSEMKSKWISTMLVIRDLSFLSPDLLTNLKERHPLIVKECEKKVCFDSFKSMVESLGIKAHVNSGTEKTPGVHLRITASSLESKALAQVLKDLGVHIEIEKEDQLSTLVIKESPNFFDYRIYSSFSQNLKEKYPIALKAESTIAVELIKATIKELGINAEVEINPGTSRTPGRHLRIVSPISLQLESFYKTLQTLGIQSEMKSKWISTMLVIRDLSFLSPDLLTNLKERFPLIVKECEKKICFDTFKSMVESLGVKAHINPGTEKTPGVHLRITASSLESEALTHVLKDMGVHVEIENEDQLSTLVIQESPNLNDYPIFSSFSQNLKEKYPIAVEKLQIKAPQPKSDELIEQNTSSYSPRFYQEVKSDNSSQPMFNFEMN